MSEPVSVPPALAAPLLRVLVRALVREGREDGGQVPAGIAEFLRDLYEAANAEPVADSGKSSDAPDTLVRPAMVSVTRLAQDTGHSARTLRHWAATGRIRAVRVGPTWAIDPESLKGRHERAIPGDRHSAP